MLFSATSTQKIEDLARLALKKEPIVVGVEDVVEKATVEGLEQGKRKGKNPWLSSSSYISFGSDL